MLYIYIVRRPELVHNTTLGYTDTERIFSYEWFNFIHKNLCKRLRSSAGKACTYVHLTCGAIMTSRALRWTILLQNQRKNPFISQFTIHVTTKKERQQNKLNANNNQKTLLRQNVRKKVALGKIWLWNVYWSMCREIPAVSNTKNNSFFNRC